jgi:hypothetical protein
MKRVIGISLVAYVATIGLLIGTQRVSALGMQGAAQSASTGVREPPSLSRCSTRDGTRCFSEGTSIPCVKSLGGIGRCVCMDGSFLCSD